MGLGPSCEGQVAIYDWKVHHNQEAQLTPQQLDNIRQHLLKDCPAAMHHKEAEDSSVLKDGKMNFPDIFPPTKPTGTDQK